MEIFISKLMLKLYVFISKIYCQHLGFWNCFFYEVTQNLLWNLIISGSLPVFLSTPSVSVGDDGFSYIVGCKFVAVEELLADLTAFAYLLVNETVKRKLNGSSRRLNENTFQLPQHMFVTPGKYQCLIEARTLYNKTILSESSAYIPMPGRIVLLCCRFCKSEN